MAAPPELPGISAELRRRFAKLSAEEQSRVLSRLAQKRDAVDVGNRIPRTHAHRFHLTSAQLRVWFLQQLDPESAAFNQSHRWRLRGPLDAAALVRSFTEIVRRHAILRTRFVVAEGEPWQEVTPASSFVIETIDASGQAESAPQLLAAFASRMAGAPFDLASSPLIRVGLARLSPDEHHLLLTRHHIVSDRWSAGLFLKELETLYAAFVTNQPSPLQELPIDYGDYAEWIRNRNQAPAARLSLERIVERLDGAAEPPSLLPDVDRAATISHRGGRVSGSIPADVVQRLRELASAEGATLFMALLAIFNTLVHRYTTQTDVVIGTPIAGRIHPDTESLLGLFANTLALRTDVSGDPSFIDLLGRVRAEAVRAFECQEIPFESVLEVIRPGRERSAAPYTPLVFALQNVAYERLKMTGLEIEELDSPLEAFAGDLGLITWEEAGRLVLRADYSADRFSAALVERMLGHFAVIASCVVESPTVRLSELPLLTRSERDYLTGTLNNTAAVHPSTRRVEELFAEQVSRRPDAVAVVGAHRSLSYQDLATHARQVASALRGLGVRRGDRVVLLLDGSWEFVASVFGVYMAGGCYVALDPHHPRVRLKLMLDDARPTAIVSRSEFASLVPPGCPSIMLDERFWRDDQLTTAWQPPAATDDNDRSTSDDVACILYTSGSTGPPKGVLMPHRAIVNHSWWIAQTYGAGDDERVLQASPFSFDASMWELTMPLITGGAVVLGSPLGRIDPPAFLKAIIDGRITSLLLVPAQIPFLLEQPDLDRCVSLRHVFVGGEIFPARFASSLAARIPARVHNIYGPTETCVNSTMHEWRRGDADTGIVPIGRPIGNTEIYLLDGASELAPIGVPGEICIGGRGVSHGYLNAPELTERRFVPHPFKPGERIYRTGDRARWREDGLLEFLGRIDDQFKLRGIRIEPGEIEAALTSHQAIGAAAVVVRGGTPETDRLNAYLVPRSAQASRPSPAELRAFLRDRLPEVMVPASYHWLDRLPLSTNGKVDRSALPDVGEELPHAAPAGTSTTPTEARLLELWAEVLGQQQAGLDDHFFDVGGHSLLAVRLFSRIEDEFGTRLRISKLFEAPTVRLLAAAIDSSTELAPTPRVAIRKEGTRVPLHIVHGIGGEVLGFEPLARHLSDEQPVFAFEALSDADDRRGVVETAKRYVDILVRAQPNGPYYIGGYSSGGPLAFEMACQLANAGRVVGLLLLLDAGLPPQVRRRLVQPPLSAAGYLQHFRCWIVDDLLATRPSDWLGRLKSNARVAATRVRSWMRGSATPDDDVSSTDVRDALGMWAFPDSSRGLLQRRWQDLKAYEPGRFAGRGVVVRSRTGRLFQPRRATSGWETLVAGGVEHFMIEGSHSNILTEPRVRKLAEIVNRSIDRAERERGQSVARG